MNKDHVFFNCAIPSMNLAPLSLNQLIKKPAYQNGNISILIVDVLHPVKFNVILLLCFWFLSNCPPTTFSQDCSTGATIKIPPNYSCNIYILHNKMKLQIA